MNSTMLRREIQHSMRGAEQRGFDVAFECSTVSEPTFLGFLILARRLVPTEKTSVPQ